MMPPTTTIVAEKGPSRRRRAAGGAASGRATLSSAGVDWGEDRNRATNVLDLPALPPPARRSRRAPSPEGRRPVHREAPGALTARRLAHRLWGRAGAARKRAPGTARCSMARVLPRYSHGWASFALALSSL